MWTSSLGIPVLEEWRAWSVDDQVRVHEYNASKKFPAILLLYYESYVSVPHSVELNGRICIATHACI